MQPGKICKISAVVLFILDLIGLWILAKQDEFTVLHVYALLSSFFFCLIVYTLGEIVDQLKTSNEKLQIANNNTYELHQLLSSTLVLKPADTVSKDTNSKPSQSTLPHENESPAFPLYEKSKSNPSDSSAPYYCGRCGKDGPYGESCPECGSTLKRYF